MFNFLKERKSQNTQLIKQDTIDIYSPSLTEDQIRKLSPADEIIHAIAQEHLAQGKILNGKEKRIIRRETLQATTDAFYNS